MNETVHKWLNKWTLVSCLTSHSAIAVPRKSLLMDIERLVTGDTWANLITFLGKKKILFVLYSTISIFIGVIFKKKNLMFSVTSCYEETNDLLPKSKTIIEIYIYII